MSESTEASAREAVAQLRGELGVMTDLLGQCLEVLLTVEADGSSESEMLHQLINATRNALAHVRSNSLRENHDHLL